MDAAWSVVEKITGIVWKKSVLEGFLKDTGLDYGSLVGEELMLHCGVNGSVKYGFSLSILAISREFTKGKQVEDKERIRGVLKKKGVFGLNRGLRIWLPPYRVAVISSPQAAGYRDFLSVCDESWWIVEHELFEAVVHGNGAAASVIEALEHIEASISSTTSYSAICILRGWWGKEWFAWQNDERLVETVCRCTLPVCVAVGHTEDRALLDEVAWLSAKTPTDAAWRLVEEYGVAQQFVGETYISIQMLVDNRLTTFKQNVVHRRSWIQAYDPVKQLKKGYYLVKDDDGNRVTPNELAKLPVGTKVMLIADGMEREVNL